MIASGGSDPVVHSLPDFFCNILLEMRIIDQFFILIIAHKGYLNQTIRVFSRAAQRKIEADAPPRLVGGGDGAVELVDGCAATL